MRISDWSSDVCSSDLATDGRSHYVEIGKGEIVPPHANGAILRIAPVETGIREVDRTIVAVAAANDGRYTIDAHLKHEPNASQTFAESHERRLEAMRRADAPCPQIGRDSCRERVWPYV